jgi:hypothetical protein
LKKRRKMERTIEEIKRSEKSFTVSIIFVSIIIGVLATLLLTGAFELFE